MGFMNSAFTPATLFFFVFLAGCLIKRIRISDISLGLSAVLIAAIAIGYFMARFCPNMLENEFYSGMSILSQIGTAMFVSVIGISSGGSVAGEYGKKDIAAFFCGVITVAAGFLTVIILAQLDFNMETSLLMGIFCGALTSSPALSALCENDWVNPELATLGYGVSYLFGVIGVVIFVQCFIENKEKITCGKDSKEKSSDNLKDLLLIAVVSIIGNISGSVRMPVVNLSIGATGGILITGVIFGYLKKCFSDNNEGGSASITVYRELGLIMFFIGNGLSAGKSLNTPLDIRWFVCGIIITMVSVLGGYFSSRFLFKNNNPAAMYNIAGGMTSTSALGVLLEKERKSNLVAYYSFAYLGALLSIVIAVRFFVFL